MDMAAGRFHAYANNTNSVGYRKKKEKVEDRWDKDILYICMKLPKNKNVFN